MASACRKSRWICLGRDVVLHTDQIAWQDLEMKNPTGVEASWLSWLLELNPYTVWIRGVENVVADCLTRLSPIQDEHVDAVTSELVLSTATATCPTQTQ